MSNFQTRNKEKIAEKVKEIMYADDVDWVSSLQENQYNSITYKNTGQLHWKIETVLSTALKEQREEIMKCIGDYEVIKNREDPLLSWKAWINAERERIINNLKESGLLDNNE